jgi:nicotinamidase-related amidase
VLDREPGDPVVRKTACDAFYISGLADLLAQYRANALILTGCATDFCVDTTVRSAAVRNFDIYVASDGHTTADRLHLDASFGYSAVLYSLYATIPVANLLALT